MYVRKIRARNFRLLKDTTLDAKKGMSLLIGKNNSGKTSFIVILENFLKNKKFYFNDFSICHRKIICNLDNSTNTDDLSIQLILEIEYSEDDDLNVLSKFMLDLDPSYRHVKILFECRIQKEKLLQKVSGLDQVKKSSYIEKNIHHYLENRIYAFDDSEFIKSETYCKDIRQTFSEKELKHVRELINIETIHAKRNVASSEYSGNKTPLSALTTSHFNNKSDTDVPNENIDSINELVSNMDNALKDQYKPIFDDFLKNARDFLRLENLNVISDIQSHTLLENSSKVIYGQEDDFLPENLNGLGYLNILYLLLTLEMKKEVFIKEKRSINLLLIEEPEAHTHPQMQYVFASKVEAVLSQVENLQTLMTSHSSCIVSHSNFEDLRYLKLENNNIKIKNFHTELNEKYRSNQDHFKFLKQYLNIQSAELFFAEKVIFIEGTTERMLLPLFIKKVDELNGGDQKYMPLSSQNISILEVGANAKTFAPFLEFLGIKALVITDIDTTECTQSNSGRTIYKACAVEDDNSNYTSNESIKFFLNCPQDLTEPTYKEWFKKMRANKLDCSFDGIKISYQTTENDYHARSFEDAFININLNLIEDYKDDDNLLGLKCRSEIKKGSNIYDLTDKIIDKKSDFASSLLFLELSGKVSWNCPDYIREGLEWLAKD